MNYGRVRFLIWSTLKLWGCLAQVVVPSPKGLNLDLKHESVFVGYALHNKAYRFFVISEQDKDFVLSLEARFSLKIIFF